MTNRPTDAGFFSAFSFDAVRRQYGANAQGLRQMLGRAEQTGKPYRGYTVAQLRQSVADYDRYATMTDAELDAHLSTSMDRVRTRLAELKGATR